MDSIEARYKSVGDQARMMGESGNVAGVQRLRKAALEQANTYEEIIKGIDAAEKNRPLLSKGIAVDTKTAELIKRIGQGKLLQGKGGILDADLAGLKQAIKLNRDARKSLEVVFNDQENKGKRVAAELDAKLNKADLPAGEGDDKGAKKALNEAEQLAKQQQQRAIELQNHRNKLAEIGFQKELAMSDDAFEHQKALIDAKNEYELSGLNDIQARQKKFAQDLEKIQLDRIATVRQAQEEMSKASFEAGAAAQTAAAAGAEAAPVAGGGAMFGETGNVRNAPGWVHGHFQSNTASLATLIGDVVPVVKQLLSQGIPVELGGGQKFNTSMSDSQIASLLRTGAGQHGHSGDGRSLDLFVPKGTKVPVGLGDVRNTGGRGGVTGVLPGSGQSWVGHLDPRSKSGGKMSSAAFSMETKAQKETFDLQQAQASQLAAQELSNLKIRNAAQLAIERTATLIKTNIDSIYPIEQQKLENQLMRIRNDLQIKGMPSELIDFEEKKAKAQMEGTMALDVMNQKLVDAKAKLKAYEDAINGGAEASADVNGEMVTLRGTISTLESAIAGMPAKQRAMNIAMLEGAIAAMKNADALKALEEVSGRIDQAVEGVTGTYKNLFIEIAKGEKPVKALKKAQEELTGQALTMFFDFAMKPMEDFLKKSLGGIFGLPDQEKARQEAISKAEEQLAELRRTAAATEQTAVNTAPGAGQAGASAAYNGQSLPASGSMATPASITESANAYSESLGKIDTSIKDTAMSVGASAEAMTAQVVPQWQKALGATVQGLGMAAGAVMGITAGIQQVSQKGGGFSSVLGGIGMIASSVGGLLGGFSQLGGLFGGGGGMNAAAGNLAKAPFAPKISPGGIFANGGIAQGGFIPFRAFANGGTVSGPTLGLMGEGRYNEAIVPLPDGKSIPVQLGGSSSRELLSGGSKQQPASPVLSMSFQSTTINGVEYVDRAQLEAAMSETRRLASRDGASRGSQLALNKIKNSPNTRRQLGLR
jgi:hypothetical protein